MEFHLSWATMFSTLVKEIQKRRQRHSTRRTRTKSWISVAISTPSNSVGQSSGFLNRKSEVRTLSGRPLYMKGQMLYNCVVFLDIGFYIPLSMGDRTQLDWNPDRKGVVKSQVHRKVNQAWTRSPMRPLKGFCWKWTRWGVKPSMLNASTAALHRERNSKHSVPNAGCGTPA